MLPRRVPLPPPRLPSGGGMSFIIQNLPRNGPPACRRLSRQKTAMLRAKNEGVVSEIEIHVEGDTREARYSDEIYRRGLSPGDLDGALRHSEQHGFKVEGGMEGREGGVVLMQLFVARRKGSLLFVAFLTGARSPRPRRGHEKRSGVMPGY